MRCARSLLLALVVVAPAVASACGAFSGGDTSSQGSTPGADSGASLLADGGAGGGGGGGPDGSASGGDAGTCVPHSAVSFFSADFDSKPAVYDVFGIGYAPPANTKNASVGFDAPGSASSSTSMHIHSTGDPYVLEVQPVDVPGGVCVIKSSFDLMIIALGPPVKDADLAVIGVRNAAFDHCYVTFKINGGTSPTLVLQSHCGVQPDAGGDYYVWKNVTSGIPAVGPNAFLHVDMTVDLPSATASIALAGGAPTSIALGTDEVKVGGPLGYAKFGFDSTGYASSGADVRLDTITVDIQ